MTSERTPRAPLIDLTGLPESVVRQVQELVDEARRQQAAAPAPIPARDGGTPPDRWAAAAEAVAGLTDYDFGAWDEQRAYDAAHGKDHLERRRSIPASSSTPWGAP